MGELYRCEHCGHIFEQPDVKTIREYHSEVDNRNWEVYEVAVCPRCESEAIETGRLCECCGQEYTADDFCEDCFDMVTDFAKRVQKRYQMEKLGDVAHLLGQWSERYW